MLDDSDKSVYLFSNEGENGLLFCLTDADGIQDLTSCFYHFTSPRLVHQFARLLELLGTERNIISTLVPYCKSAFQDLGYSTMTHRATFCL